MASDIADRSSGQDCFLWVLLLDTWGWGLRPKAIGLSLEWTNGWDYLQATYYSFRGHDLSRLDDWLPVGYAQVLIFPTLLAPIFLGLLALALRDNG